MLAELKVPEKRQTFHAQWVRLFINRMPGNRRRSDLNAEDTRRFLTGNGARYCMGIEIDEKGTPMWT